MRSRKNNVRTDQSAGKRSVRVRNRVGGRDRVKVRVWGRFWDRVEVRVGERVWDRVKVRVISVRDRFRFGLDDRSAGKRSVCICCW